MMFLMSLGLYAQNDALFISQDLPESVEAGQEYDITVTFKNTGNTTWTTDAYKLGTQKPLDNALWTGTSRIELPGNINPGEEVTFNISIKAPLDTGYYAIQWRMLQGDTEWFGETSDVVYYPVGLNVAARIPDSPYPVSFTPEKIYVINDWGWGDAKRFTTITLQGHAARSGKSMIYNESGTGHMLWVDDLVEKHYVTEDKSFYDDFEGLVTHFKDLFDGYILCDLKDNSSNVAVSLCSQLNAIAVTPDNVALMEALDKPMLLDVRGKDESWVLGSEYGKKLSKSVACLQNEEKCMFLSDYAVFANAFQFFDQDINSSFITDAFSRMDSNKIVLGWGPDEEHTIRKVSENSLYLNAADWTENIPVLSNFEVQLKQHTHATEINEAEDVHTVCFLVSDGDNYDWLLNEFYTKPEAYGSPNRGKVSIGWTISPAMCELAPTVMQFFYDKATNTPEVKDFFIGSSSGIGYMNPDIFPDLQSSVELTNAFFAKADLNILNIIGTEYREEDMMKYLTQDNIDAIFYYDYANYAGRNGAIYIVNDKPVVTARYRMWDGFDDAASVAEKLNKQSTDAFSADGYSLIAVHSWSFNNYVVDEINSCVSQLNDNVIVVTPDEFIKRIKKKLGIKTPIDEFNVYPNPCSSDEVVHIDREFNDDDELYIYSISGAKIFEQKFNTKTIGFSFIPEKMGMRKAVYLLVLRNGKEQNTRKLVVK
jgi:hypothetical protein